MTYYGSNTIDLNGFTVTANNSSGVLFAPYVSAYKMTLQNSAENQGHYVCEYLQVYNDGTLAIPAENNNLTISAVLIKSDGNANLAGGSFGKISVEGEKTLAGLLVSGYYFADTASGEPAAMYDADGTALTELTNVTVQPCSHDTAVCGSDGVWKCLCGQNVFVASVTKDGTPTYYTDLQNAFSAADGNTVKLMANVRDVTVSTDKPFTFDLNGYNVYSLTVNNKSTIKDSATVKGKITEWLKVPSGMTVGELLEDGYAFKKSNGTWCSGVEQAGQAVGNVSIWPVPIRSVTAANPSVTVAYGQTSGRTLTATVVPFAEGGPYTCQWYKIGGTSLPLDGATDSTYQLPVDLAAGTYTYRLTATEDGYEKSCDFTVTVTPVSIEGAAVNVQSLTYNGVAQNPTATVTLGETVLTGNKDYTVMTTAQTNVGSYTLTVTGKGNYTGKIENVNWKIEPMQLYRFCDIEPVTKVYDGTAVAPIAKSALAFHDANARGASVTLPEDAYDITNARFTMRQGDGTYVESPEAGNGKSLSFTVMLKSGNYVFKGGTADVMDCDYTTDKVDMFTIMQDTISLSGIQFTQYVFNDLAKTYEINLKQFLDTILPADGEYGNIVYGQPSVSMDSAYYTVGGANIENGKLSLSINKTASSKQGDEIGTVTVKVETTNYQPFTLTIHVIAQDKFAPVMDGTISASEITYGQALADSKLTVNGTMQDPTTGNAVNGTFAWKNGTIQPAANDSYEAEWVFTPAEGYEEYATATGTVTIKVNKATPTFTAPTAQENLTYTGQEQALITAGSVTDYGTMQYSLTENGTYSQNIPTGTDAGAYTVWYRVIGDANHNDTAPASVAVSIGKKPLTITGVTTASKPYDGTTNADISSVTFDNVTLNRGTDYTVTASFDDAGVGSGKNVTATVTLMGQAAKNYALEQSSFPTTASITKAAAPDFTKETVLTIVNDCEKTYTVTLPTLPTLETPKKYGALTYEVGEIKLNDGYYTSGAKVENGKLILQIQKNDVKTTGSVGTATVVIKSTNYEDITLTVNISAENKRIPTVTEPTVNTLTYNGAEQALVTAGKTTGGTMLYRLGDSEWSEQLPTAKNAGKYTVWYKVQGDAEYADVAEQSLTVTAVKKAVTVTALDKSAYTGSTAPDLSSPEADKNYKVEGLLGADTLSGTVTLTYEQTPDMSKPGKTAINIAGTLSNDNYEITYVSGTLTVSDRSSSGGGGSSSDRDTSSSGTVKTETTKNNDGSVTKTETKKDGTVIETTTGKDGSTVKTETKKDGSSVTETKAADGSTATVKTDKNGQTEAKTALSNKAIETAKRNGEPVKAPVEVKATRDSDTAPTVKIELPRNSGDTKVEIPVSNVKPGTVAVIVHPDGTEEIVKNSLPTENGIQLTVNGGATVKIVDNSKDFADTRNHWAKDAIDFVSARGLVNGMSATIYAPNNSTTRAQLWTILARQADADLTGGATWFENAQNWAKAKGVSDGANPNAAINRAQMVTMLWRAVGQPVAGSTANFADVSADAYYASAVAWAVENGITTGVGNGKFDPNATCTRGQIVTFLYRAFNK